MRETASFTFIDLTREASLSERGVPHLLAGCALFLLTVIIALSICDAMFSPWVLFWCIAAAVSSLVAAICAVRIFYLREKEFGLKCRQAIEKTMSEELAGSALDDEILQWVENECLMHCGGATSEPTCFVKDGQAFLLCFDKGDPEIHVELWSGEIARADKEDSPVMEMSNETRVGDAPADTTEDAAEDA